MAFASVLLVDDDRAALGAARDVLPPATQGSNCKPLNAESLLATVARLISSGCAESMRV